MNHREAGIKKKASEAVYPADIIADSALERCSLAARGAWYECLLRMWRDGTCEISGSIEELAHIWRVTVPEADGAIKEFVKHKPCDVTINNNVVTLVSRRLERRTKAKKDGAKRQQKYRSTHASDIDVTDEYIAPSSSLSSSSSISSTDKERRRFSKPSIEELKTHIAEKEYSIDAEAFIAFYESKGWKVGSQAMKSWQSACVTWEKRKNENDKPKVHYDY